MGGKQMKYLIPLLIFSLSLVGCASQASSSSSAINNNDTGKTVIKAISRDSQYPNNSYMIISKNGTVVVADPNIPLDGIKPDIITVTHLHDDHIDKGFLEKNKTARQSVAKAESFAVKDVNVTGIASSHMGDAITTLPTNIIYVFEVDGLRIAHMGDIGQKKLTEEQLAAIGKIDVAFMQFVNLYSDYSVENGKGFTLIEQLKPQIIIPTHSSSEANDKIAGIVGEKQSVSGALVVSKEDLSDGKRKVVLLNR
jgi:L-ascorbate metabolism protein UlaG (beta-lactamase superfamily)